MFIVNVSFCCSGEAGVGRPTKNEQTSRIGEQSLEIYAGCITLAKARERIRTTEKFIDRQSDQ